MRSGLYSGLHTNELIVSPIGRLEISTNERLVSDNFIIFCTKIDFNKY